LNNNFNSLTLWDLQNPYIPRLNKNRLFGQAKKKHNWQLSTS
jgi:hypothetical protein